MRMTTFFCRPWNLWTVSAWIWSISASVTLSTWRRIRRGDADIRADDARAVRRDDLVDDDVHLALVRATSSSVLAHVVALDCAHHDHRPLSVAGGEGYECALVERLVTEPDDGRAAPIVLTQQCAREIVAVQVGQRQEDVVLSIVVGGPRRDKPIRGVARDVR